MDVLANVLNVTQLATHMLGVLEFVPPWGVIVDTREKAVVHIVRRGAAWLRLDEHPEPIRLETGDVVLLASGGAHTLASDLDARLEPCEQAVARAQSNVVQPLARTLATAARESTVIQCAGYRFGGEKRTHPLISLLPPVVHLRAEQANGDAQLQSLLRLLSFEALNNEAGHELVAPRLIDTLLVYTLRVWLRDQPEGRCCGWLGALRDPQIRKALGFIHEAPHAPWTVEQLARAVAMSRAAFARRFTELTGEPPLAYVTRWRMSIASKMLSETREPIAAIARRVGYESETAFAKAFRRHRAISPGEYRFQARTAVAAKSAPVANPSTSLTDYVAVS